MKTFYSLYLKDDNLNKYYKHLTSLFKDNKNLKVSKFTLDRKDLQIKPYENDICVIQKHKIQDAKQPLQTSG